MFSMMRGNRIAASSSAETPLQKMLAEGVRSAPDVAALASLDGDHLCVMAWHYHDDDLPGPDAGVTLTLNGLPENWTAARVVHYRIDENHSNAYAEWQRMDSPLAPNERDYERLKRASELATLSDPEVVAVEQQACEVKFPLPRQAVSLIVFEPASSTAPAP